ncbi:urease accessory protein UreF [Mesorhizobium sp. YIM 152430]|uniref:urease accessory protein UreF n=1 Tax=Mesorhizobium sp. YIM 152430 TaxID=3031761 RepID=UPI0023DAC589|nr:urease accessory protein UreF [Mesorhizobium sp. YIM 152430]MDF1600974.1 urease accessory protein UreF [Mesorhizobium sp. YIM 152430]
MADPSSTLRLMAWLSPAFPVGTFSYSHGLERAAADGRVGDLGAWLDGLMRHGTGWNDAVIVAEAWRRGRDGGDIGELAELGEALAGSAERHLETMAQGQAFAKAVAGWTAGLALPTNCPYPVVFGASAGFNGLPFEGTIATYCQAFVSNQIQAGIRLSLLGQERGVAVLREMEATIIDITARAANSSLDDLGGSAFIAEIAAMNHETQYSRLFRT